MNILSPRKTTSQCIVITLLILCSFISSLSAQEKITLDEIQKLFMPDDEKSRLIHFSGYWADVKSRSLLSTINSLSKNKRENLEVYVIVSNKNEEQKRDFLKWYRIHKMNVKYYEADYEEASYYFIDNRAESYMIDHELKCSWTFDEDTEKHRVQLFKIARKQPKSNFTIGLNKIVAEELDQIIPAIVNAKLRNEEAITGLLAYIEKKGGVKQLTLDSQKLISQAADGSNIPDMTEKQLEELIRITFLKIEDLINKEGMRASGFTNTFWLLKMQRSV